ncbi:putative transposase [Acetobacter senegalensis]|uniref:Putative transposase n=1 Tax=Acetobacter senegalensis TaxID=446692 RepID=A0A0U5F1P6_9PROT|nr:putative transposase [Acetobacter senegalensis]CEF41868.1 putative transposase [Acetobacter senegalensis]
MICARGCMKNMGVSLSVSWLSRIVRSEGFRLLTARPRQDDQNPDVQSILKKTSLTPLLPSGPVIPGKISNCGGRTKRGSARKQS